MYLKPFRKWSKDRPFSQLERGLYIAPNKPIKPTQTILEKAQQKSIIAHAARQR